MKRMERGHIYCEKEYEDRIEIELNSNFNFGLSLSRVSLLQIYMEARRDVNISHTILMD